MSLFGLGFGPDEEIADEGEAVVISGRGAAPKRIFERKYRVPREKRRLVLALLRHRALVPREFPDARIRTVYFDDREHTSFYESVDGAMNKRKYRLREYVGAAEGAKAAPGGASYSIEIKIRRDSTTEKLKELVYAPLPAGYRFTTFRGLIGDLEALDGAGSLARLRAALPESELYADAVVSYDRYRFDDPTVDARYNLDVSVAMCNEDVRGAFTLPTAGVAALGHDIFEIKSGAPMGLPKYLSGLGIEPMSFSKFVWGKEIYYYL